jgi:hypothetical protein
MLTAEGPKASFCLSLGENAVSSPAFILEGSGAYDYKPVKAV